MPWLKGRTSHAHGLGSPEYQEILNLRDLELMKDEFQFEFSDRDGIRSPVFEVIEKLPPGIREQKIRILTSIVTHHQARIARLIKERQD